jgi:hypothetical protein
MNDKQVFAAIVGGFVSACFGGLLVVPIMFLAHANDGGDDGWGLLWILLLILSGIVGFAFSAKWARVNIS